MCMGRQGGSGKDTDNQPARTLQDGEKQGGLEPASEFRAFESCAGEGFRSPVPILRTLQLSLPESCTLARSRSLLPEHLCGQSDPVDD